MSESVTGKSRGFYTPTIPDDRKAVRDKMKDSGLARKRDAVGTPRYTGGPAAVGPSLKDVVGGYVAEWGAVRAGAGFGATTDDGEDE